MQKYPTTTSTTVDGVVMKKGRGHYSSKKRHAAQDKRRAEADLRQLKYNDLTVDQKLARIKARPGQSKREFDRIIKHVAEAKAKPAPAPVVKSAVSKKQRK